MFEQVLTMALEMGAVDFDGSSYISHEHVHVHAHDLGAEFYEALCEVAGYHVDHESYGDVLCCLLEMVADDFDQDECFFSGSVGGSHYCFYVEFYD